MLQENEYVSRDALGLAELVRAKKVKPEELLEKIQHLITPVV